jgi:hypothetical protein
MNDIQHFFKLLSFADDTTITLLRKKIKFKPMQIKQHIIMSKTKTKSQAEFNDK